MTWHVIRVRSKDAQKQLARTSLRDSEAGNSNVGPSFRALRSDEGLTSASEFLLRWPIHLEEEGGRATPLYGLYRYVRPQTVWFFSRFRHK